MKKLFPIYPLLLGIIWVLFTYSSNASKLPSAGVVVMPLLAVTGVLLIVYGASWLIVRDWRKAALIVGVFFFFSVLHGYIRSYTKIDGVASAFIWLAFIVVGGFVVVKLTTPWGRNLLTVIGNVVCLAMLLVGISSTVMSTVSANSSTEVESQAVAINEIPETLPDIYYIVPDTFTSYDVLGRYLDYDAGDFYSFLYDESFYIKTDSYANYHHSILSIASVLNMRYWTDEELGNNPSGFLGDRLYQNPVGDTVKEAGYTYIQVGSWWGFTSDNVRADITMEYSSLNELALTLYETTLWCDLGNFLFDVGSNRVLRDGHLNQFDNLVRISEMEEPTFTFCHLILPHGPFLFEADGTPTFGWYLGPDTWRGMYLEQLEFTSTKLMETISYILLNSPTPPIIILASDEGYSDRGWLEYLTSHNGLDAIMDDRPDLAIMRQGNLFAILNPYGSDLPKPESPVNAFRYVFNSLFDSRLEYLPDRFFLKAYEMSGEEFIDITEELAR